MKKIIIISFICIVISSCEKKYVSNRIKTTDSRTYDYFVKVVKITDGDTFTGLTQDKIEIVFRIHGIDAPERKQAFGTKSKAKLSELIFNKRVGIIVQTKRDAYGRPVVWVYTPDGNDVSAEMLKSGLAWHYKKYDASENYSSLEIEARANKVGLWVDANLTEPWNFRE